MSKTKEVADVEKVRIVPTSFSTTYAQYIYMRPNIANGGQLPASGPYCTSPDIWANGTTPIANYQTALATSTSYNTDPPSNIQLGMDNYIYVRGYNGNVAANTVSVTLYYAASSLIQYPGDWQNNIILTDQGQQTSSITNLAPATVGVAADTFLWANVPPPANSTDHYCLITQLNDNQNSNPFPPPYSILDLSALITNNLQWGWHNMNLMSKPASLTFMYDTGLAIPQNGQKGTYTIAVSPIGFIGWQVSFQCSQMDSKGNPISFPVTTIVQDNLSLGVQNVYLEPGYSAIVSVYMYNPNNVTPATGATVPIVASYLTNSPGEYNEALERGLINWPLTKALLGEKSGMPIQGYVSVGAVTGYIQ